MTTHQLWPLPAREVGDADLEALYRYPAPEGGWWLAVNFVHTVDGAIELEGRSRGISTVADKRVHRLASDLADVVLIASGTAVAEDYAGLRPDAASAERRRRHGLAPVPPLAVVSGSGSLPPDAASIVDVAVPTVVVTCAAVPAARRDAWHDAGARVLVAGADRVDLRDALARLAAEGLCRVDCEGGPGLVGSLLAEDLVDEMRIDVAPVAVAGRAHRVASSEHALAAPAGFTLASLLVEDSTVLPRWVRTRDDVWPAAVTSDSDPRGGLVPEAPATQDGRP